MTILLCLCSMTVLYGQEVPVDLADLEPATELEQEDLASDLVSRFEDLQQTPLDINGDEAYALVDLGLMRELQWLALKRHIALAGPLLEIEELQAIEHIFPEDIRSWLPFIRIPHPGSPIVIDPLAALSKADHRLLFRVSRTIEPNQAVLQNKFKGDQNGVLLKYKISGRNVFDIGLTAEKDPGEPMFHGVNPAGFDFISGYLRVLKPASWIDELIVGDYTCSMGEGLLMHGGFGYGKSSAATAIKKSGKMVRPYQSVGEKTFLRGLAMLVHPVSRMNLLVFASRSGQDAVVESDTAVADSTYHYIKSTSLITSGYHRTERELSSRNTVKLSTLGMSADWDLGWGALGLNFLRLSTDFPFERQHALYRKYLHLSQRRMTGSLDYAFFFRNVHVFGEVALDHDRDVSWVSGLQAGLGKKIDLAIHLRYIPPQFYAQLSNVFGETSSGTNEVGYYVGSTLRPSHQLTLQVYFDFWHHPWLRYTADAPGRGREMLVKMAYKVRKKWELYAQFQHETKELNAPDNASPVDRLVWQTRSRIRAQYARKWSRHLETRHRIELSFYRLQHSSSANGFYLAQDVLYRPLGKPLSFTARFALFDTDGYNARIYAYENDVSFGAFIPALSDSGARYYLNMKYKGIRHLTLEARFARSVYLDRTTVGSGDNTISGNVKTDVRLQAILTF